MPEKEDGVQHLKDELYSRKREGVAMQDVRAPLTHSDAEAPKQWTQPEVALKKQSFTYAEDGKQPMGLATKFLIGAGVFFVVAVAGAALFFFSGGNYISSNNIDLQVVAPTLVNGGTTATIQYIITNRNSVELQLADLVIAYPAGTRDPKTPTKALSHERISVGTIAPGRQVKLTSSAIFYGSEGSTQPIQASLEYSVAGSNAVFAKTGDATVTLGSSPVSMRVDAPQEAIAGQPFTITLTVSSNAQAPVQDVLVQAQYPFGFSVRSTTPRADAGSTIWRLGTMAPGSTQTIKLTGTIDGQDGDERVVRFSVGTNQDQTASSIKVPFLSVPSSLTVRRPFITGVIAVNGQTGNKINATAGQGLQSSITWQNNLQESVTDVQLKLTLSGPSLDRTSIQAGNGFYQSNDSTITWTSAQDPSLAQVPPGGTGVVTFSFGTLPPGAGGVVYQNPTINLSLAVSAVRAGESGVPETVASAATAQVTLASVATLTAQALHFTGPFNNTGPMPPRAESPTGYTVQWTAKNSSNALANATVSTVLPPYTSFVTGQAGVTYDASTRTVKWDLGDLGAGVGYSSGARKAAFQVLLTPSASQVGQTPMVTGQALLAGTDRFAQVQVTSTTEAPTTRLQESGFASGMDVVQPK